jgi:hypothetical protein
MPTGVTVGLLLLAACAVLGLPRGIPELRGRAAESSGPPGGITDVPLMLDLIGAMLTAGAPVTHALGVLADSCAEPVALKLRGVRGALELGAEWNSAWDSGPAPRGREGRMAVDELRSALGFAAVTGAPSAAIVHARAAQLRRRQNRALERRAAALGVRLVVPLGVCALPAFACLGVVPVVLALLPTG